VIRIVDQQIYVRPEGGGLLVGGYGYEPASFDMDEFPKTLKFPRFRRTQSPVMPCGTQPQNIFQYCARRRSFRIAEACRRLRLIRG